MSWLGRLFGKRPALDPEVRRIMDTVQADQDRSAAEARPELLRLLRDLGARSALVRYDGGHDEGSVTEIWYSREALGTDPKGWREQTLPDAQQVAIDWDVLESDPPGLFDAAMEVVAGKWSGFAGEFFVRGRLVIDVESDRIARHDDMWLTEDDEVDEDEVWEEGPPKREPDEREVEDV